MKIVIAPDSYKGALRAPQVADAIASGWCSVRQQDEIFSLPMSDGGEGICETLVNAMNGAFQHLETVDAMMRSRRGRVGICKEFAVLESAEANGIELLARNELNPMRATSYGVGLLLRQLLVQNKCRKIIIGIGGSATVDGGAGMLQALGVRFLDAENREFPAGIGGGMLRDVKQVDCSAVVPEVSKAELIVACDVTNVLCGANGSAAVFGPQKGATPDMVVSLDENLRHFAALCGDDGNAPGDGAAGGLGFALRKLLHAKVMPGAELVMECVQLDKVLTGADLLITGEGCSDDQTACGKLCAEIAKRAAKYAVPAVLLSGALRGNCRELEKLFAGCFSISTGPGELSAAMAQTGENLFRHSAALAAFASGIIKE